MTKTANSPQAIELARIKTALIRAGFKIDSGNRPDVLYVQGVNYTVTCYYSDEFNGWRLTPYDDRIQRVVREAIDDAKG